MALDQAVLATVHKITTDDVKRGSKAFAQNGHRGRAYADALNEVQNNFGRPDRICNGICDLLDAWHNSFYRFGPFDKAEVLRAVERCHRELVVLRAKNIRDVKLDADFETEMRPIFDSLLDATAGKNRRFTRRTVTGTSKGLSLIAPDLFPMVDEAISVAYRCPWVYSEFGLDEYIKFTTYMKILAERLASEYSQAHKIRDLDQAEMLLVKEVKAYSGDEYQYSKSLLKTIDEYNYAKHTQVWC